jgi:hypothetical protein
MQTACVLHEQTRRKKTPLGLTGEKSGPNFWSPKMPNSLGGTAG